MDRIITLLTGVSGAAYQLAGLGDLLTTATSAGSHHHELGRKIARGLGESLQGEGTHTLYMVEKFALFPAAQYPLYHFMHSSLRDSVGLGEKLLGYLDSVYFKNPRQDNKGAGSPVLWR